MTTDGSREHALARPAGAENPLLLSFTAFQSEIDSLLKTWGSDIVRAQIVVARERDLSDDAAEECAQATRLAVARVTHRAEEVGPFYLRRVVQNAVRGEARRERRRYGGCVPLNETAVEAATAPADEDPDDAISLAAQWTATLPDRLQRVNNLLYVRGHSQRAAAAVMHVSQPRVAQLHSALPARGARNSACSGVAESAITAPLV